MHAALYLHINNISYIAFDVFYSWKQKDNYWEKKKMKSNELEEMVNGILALCRI